MMLNINLTSLAEMYAEGKHQAEVAKVLKVSRSAVSQATKKLLDSGSITLAPESTYHQKFYHVSPVLTMGEKHLTNGRYEMVFDPHNYGLKFKIVPGFEGRLFPGNQVRKRNWDAQYLSYLNVNLEKTTQHLIGKIDERLKFNISDSREAENARATVHSIITRAAEKVAEEYDMKIDLNHPIVCNMELGIRDPLITAKGIAYRADTHKKVYPEDNKIEFTDAEHMKNFVDNRIFENKIDQVLFVTKNLSDNIATHLRVLEKMENNEDREAVALDKIGVALEKTSSAMKDISAIARELTARKVRHGHIITKRRGT